MSESSLGRLAGVLFSPAKVFESIRQRPTWAAALVLLMLTGTLVGLLVSQRLDTEEMLRESFAQAGRQVSEEQVQQAIDFTERFGWLFAVLSSLVATPAGYLTVGLVFWVVLRLVGADLDYRQSLSVTLHAMMPQAVSQVLSLPVILSRSTLPFERLQTGLLASNLSFLAPEDAGLRELALYSSFDLFSLWTAVLLAIGYGVVAGVSKAKAAGTVAGLWLLYILGKVAWVSLAG